WRARQRPVALLQPAGRSRACDRPRCSGTATGTCPTLWTVRDRFDAQGARDVMTPLEPETISSDQDTAPDDPPIFTVGGGDWEEVLRATAECADERIIVNMGPQHPSTHGVLRLILEIEGESVIEIRCVIGYLHTGIEKNLEFRNWAQG